MTAALQYHWTTREFLRAWEAGVFEQRVELIDGEVWPVPIGLWHGDTTGRLVRALPNDRFVVTTSSLPLSGSVPDPDCWVRAHDAVPATTVSARLAAWRPEDVLLVVEVGDETVEADLGVKARLYAAAGLPVYWVVTQEGIVEHRDPGLAGYAAVRSFGPDAEIPIRHAGTTTRVSSLLAATG